MADPITDERLREMANGATIYGHERNAIAAELLAARADLREAMELLRAYGQPHYWVGLTEAIGWNASYRKLLEKHKETP